MGLKHVLLMTVSLVGSLALGANDKSSPLCLQSDQKEFIHCLNSVVIPDQMSLSEKASQSIAARLMQSHELPLEIHGVSFSQAYGVKNGLSAIEVGSFDYATEGQDFTPAKFFKKHKAAYIENNIRRTMNFVAWYHGRNFGRTGSMVFSFRRVEIQALSTPNIGMELKDKTLLVRLPENRYITEKELIEFWSEGRVLVPAKYAELPMSWIQFFAKFADQGFLAQKVLQNWKFLNPVGEFRVGLHALYLSKVEVAKELIQRESASEQQKGMMVSFLNNPTEIAKSLDSLFSFEAADSKKGVVVINRTTGFCPIKVSNSHVINVSVKASRFQAAKTSKSGLTVKVENGSTIIEAEDSQPVHIVNDKTYAGLVCVDTHDNVDVSLDIVFGQINEALTPEVLVDYAKTYAL